MQILSFPSPIQRNGRGYALMITLCFLIVTLVVFASIMFWISSNSHVTARNNQFNMSEAGAEAATEKVLSQMNYDYVAQSLTNGGAYYSTQHNSQYERYGELAHPICLQRHQRPTRPDQRQHGSMDHQLGASELAIHGVVWLGAGCHHHRHRHASQCALRCAGHRLRDNSIRLHPPLSIRHIL